MVYMADEMFAHNLQPIKEHNIYFSLRFPSRFRVLYWKTVSYHLFHEKVLVRSTLNWKALLAEVHPSECNYGKGDRAERKILMTPEMCNISGHF